MTKPMQKAHNLNRFDYYLLSILSYIGGLGCWIAWFMAIWIAQYRWQLIFTGILLVVLDASSEAGIRYYKDSKEALNK